MLTGFHRPPYYPHKTRSFGLRHVRHERDDYSGALVRKQQQNTEDAFTNGLPYGRCRHVRSLEASCDSSNRRNSL